MATTKNKFSPSVNILRDKQSNFDYTSTRNASQSVGTILSNYKSGVRSFVIIGAYGTGKSSFLLALRQNLIKSKSVDHFPEHKKTLAQLPSFEFIDLQGEFSSLEEKFANELDVDKKLNSTYIIKELEKRRKLLEKKGKGLAIIIDEFGKFLEFAAKNSPESELYFIQQLSEWVNDPEHDSIFITTLHQDFSAYSLELSRLQRNEWDKVKGRLKELPFNEPVEQLLLLAAKRIDKKFSNIEKEKNFEKLFNIIDSSKVFPFRNYFDKELAQSLYPFDILSGAVLTLALQKYGQNERSLFSFIDSNDELGISNFSNLEKPYYSFPSIYDYLINGYYSYINSKYNPHYNTWSSIQHSIEKIDGMFSSLLDQSAAESIIKFIGLLSIFASNSAKLEPKFYIQYSKLALGVANSDTIIETLEKKKIIRFVKHSVKYVLAEGTDLDIELAIDDAGRIIEKVSNVVQQLSQLFDFPFISAKENVYKTGTPRYFQFKLTESPILAIPEGEVDGFINLVFAEGENIQQEIIDCSLNCKEAILFGYYKNTSEIKSLLFEIQKIGKVKEANAEDKVAIRELNEIQDHYVRLVNHKVLENIYKDSANVVWFFQGKEIEINSRQEFNRQLSKVCDAVYRHVPVFKNEMVNKTKVSGQIAFARRKLIDRLIENIDQPNIGFQNDEFPPEKSIYLSLLLKTGVHKYRNNSGQISKPTDTTFVNLWDAGLEFLKTTKNKERKLTELIEVFSSKPFKLKDGFIDFWLPVFLLGSSHEFALYESQIYVPDINSDVLELVNKRPSLFTIKAFDVAGVKLDLFKKYRTFLNQSTDKTVSNKSFIETIKPFLVFYKDLPEFTKKTQRWLSQDSIAVRSVIANAKDPEKTFFEDFPTALGFSAHDFDNNDKAVAGFITKLKKAIKELQGCHDKLLDHFENYFIKEILGIESTFPSYKSQISLRFQGLKQHLLMPSQKTFVTRLFSELDERNAWLGSIAQSLIGKSLINIQDEDQDILYQKLKTVISELDNLCELSENTQLDESEDLLKLEITSFKTGLKKNILRLPKNKVAKIEKQISKIKTNLGSDSKENLIVLTKLLQEILTNEQKG